MDTSQHTENRKQVKILAGKFADPHFNLDLTHSATEMYNQAAACGVLETAAVQQSFREHQNFKNKGKRVGAWRECMFVMPFVEACWAVVSQCCPMS